MIKDYLYLQERNKTSLLTSKLLFNRKKKKKRFKIEKEGEEEKD